MITNIEQSLNGGYLPLYGEIVDKDIHRLRNVEDIVSVNDPSFIHEHGHSRGFDFTPDVIFDLGANVGIFSRYARSLFPDALIVAIEPDANNCHIFKKFTADSRIILIEKAIGCGVIYHCEGAVNGSGEVYLSAGSGFDELHLNEMARITPVESVTLPELRSFINKGDKTILKMDIEGNEQAVLCDDKSIEFLKTIDYFVLELHYYAQNHESVDKVKDTINRAVKLFEETHEVSYGDIGYLFACKKTK